MVSHDDDDDDNDDDDNDDGDDDNDDDAKAIYLATAIEKVMLYHTLYYIYINEVYICIMSIGWWILWFAQGGFVIEYYRY